MSVPRLARLRLRPEESLKVPHRSMRKPEGRQRPTGARASREKRARISQEKARTPGEEKIKIKIKKKSTRVNSAGGGGEVGRASMENKHRRTRARTWKKKSPRATPHKLRGKKIKPLASTPATDALGRHRGGGEEGPKDKNNDLAPTNHPPTPPGRLGSSGGVEKKKSRT